jgi:hypothetical protein
MQITDRAKDVIKSGGEWISSIEIENIAVGHPAVAEAAVIGVAHPKWDERPLLLVVLKDGQTATKEEILRLSEGKIAKWWMPDDVIFVDDIPRIFPFCLYAGAAGVAWASCGPSPRCSSTSAPASGYAVVGLLGSLAIMALPAYTALYMVDLIHAIPPIHDISTDTEYAPQFVALLHNRPGATNPPDYDGPKLVKNR